MNSATAFDVKQVCTWTLDRQYRVYLHGQKLYFIRIGGQEGLDHVAIQFGAIGALIAALLKSRCKSKNELAAMDQCDPQSLLADHKHNFCIGRDEVVDSSLDPLSILGQHGPHVGRWSLLVKQSKRRLFQFQKPEEMRTALEHLPQLLGPMLQLNGVWDEKKQRYRKP